MVKSYLDASCDPDDWNNIPTGEKLLLELKASVDPIFFWNHPKMGNYPLWPAKAELLTDFYKYDSDGKRLYSELIFMGGMRSGKSMGAGQISLIETYKLLMMKNPQEHYKLGPGTEITNINVANSRDQAKDTVFRKIIELVQNSPYFMSMNPDYTSYQLKFPKNIVCKALGSNLSSNVGRTVKSFVADEIATYDDPEDTYQKLSKSTINFMKWNEGVKVMIGSPTYEGDYLTTTLKRAREEKWSTTLTLWKPTWELNPDSPDEETRDIERAKDPERWDRDMGAQPMTMRENLFNGALLANVAERCKIVRNLFMGHPDKLSRDAFIPEIDFTQLVVDPNALDYYVTTDPAVLHDSFGLSVGYLSGDNKIKVIGSTIFKAAKNDEISTNEIAKVLKPIFETLPVKYYIFDVYLHNELQLMAQRYGISVIQNIVKLPDWIYTRNDLYNGNTTVPHSDYLFKEFRELIIINNKKVDHPRSGSKDQADTIAQLTSFIRREQEEARLNNGNSVSHFVATF